MGQITRFSLLFPFDILMVYNYLKRFIVFQQIWIVNNENNSFYKFQKTCILYINIYVYIAYT